MTEVHSSENSEATVKFEVKSNKIESSSHVELKFTESLSANLKIIEDFAYVKIENPSQFTLQLCEIEQVDINFQLCTEQLPITLDPGQEYHFFFSLPNASAQVIIRYLPSLLDCNKFLLDYISPKICEYSLQIPIN